MAGGRPSKLSAEVQERLCEAVRAGNPPRSPAPARESPTAPSGTGWSGAGAPAGAATARCTWPCARRRPTPRSPWWRCGGPPAPPRGKLASNALNEGLDLSLYDSRCRSSPRSCVISDGIVASFPGCLTKGRAVLFGPPVRKPLRHLNGSAACPLCHLRLLLGGATDGGWP